MKLGLLIKRFSPVLLVVGLFMFVFFVKFPSESQSLSLRLFQVLFQPVYRVSKYTADSITSMWGKYMNLVHVEEENRVLKREIQKYEGLKIQATELHKEVERLRGLLGLRPKLPFQLRVSEVIALNMSLERHAFWIDAGNQQGVTLAQPVIDHNGVIGQVFEVYSTRSLVLTLHDPLFRLHVLNSRTDERAVLMGQVQGELLQLRYLHRNSDTQVGDVFITSGLGGVFPRGIGVGTVDSIVRPKTGLESQVWIKPLVDVSRVQQVFIVASQSSP